MTPISLRKQVGRLFSTPKTQVVISVGKDDVILYRQSMQNNQMERIEFLRLKASTWDGSTIRQFVLPAIKRLGFEARDVILELPSDAIMRPQVTLPQTVESNLHEALYYMIDTHTPLQPEQAFFDYRILSRDNDTKKLLVEMIVAPKWAANKATEPCFDVGFRPACVDIVSTDGSSGCGINLLPKDERAKQWPPRIGANSILALAAGLLVGGALILPFYQQAKYVSDTTATIKEISKEAESAGAVARAITSIHGARLFLDEQMSNTPPLMAVLDELARVLPNDTWVYELRLNGKELHLVGNSAKSTALIGFMEESPLFSNVSFSSAVTQVSNSQIERFAISATISDTEDK